MERFFILLILAGLSVSGVAQKSMWLIAGQSNASGMGDRRTSMKYYSKECFDYVQSGDSLKILQDPVGENGKYFGKANSGSISPSFAWNLNKMTGDSVVVVSAARGGSACSTTGETIYGTWAEKGVLPLFDAAMAKCNSAIAVTGLKFSGVIWLQENVTQMLSMMGKWTVRIMRRRFAILYSGSESIFMMPTFLSI